MIIYLCGRETPRKKETKTMTTAELIAKTAVLTMEHMAEAAGITMDEVLKMILEGGAARARFDAYMEIAVRELAK